MAQGIYRLMKVRSRSTRNSLLFSWST